MISHSKLIVKKSTLPGSGRGLFTRVFIPKGTKIIEYKGKISSWKDADHENGTNAYLFYVNKNHVINAKPDKKQLARFANDAKGPKKLKGVSNNAVYIIGDNNKVFVKAFRDIPAGNEILVGYGKEYWDILSENLDFKS